MFFTQKKIPLPTGLRWHRLNLCDLQISNDEQNVLFHSFFPLCHFGAFLGGCLCIVAFIWGILQDFVMCEVWRHCVMLCSCTIFCHFVILSFCRSLQHCQWAPSPCSCWHSRHFSLAKSAHWHQLIKYLWLLFFKPYFFFLVVFEQVLLRNHVGFRSILCNIVTILIFIQCKNMIWFISFWFTLFILHRLCHLGAVAFGIRSVLSEAL